MRSPHLSATLVIVMVVPRTAQRYRPLKLSSQPQGGTAPIASFVPATFQSVYQSG